MAPSTTDDPAAATNLSRRGLLGMGAGLLGRRCAGCGEHRVGARRGGRDVGPGAAPGSPNDLRRDTRLPDAVRKAGAGPWLERQLRPAKVSDTAMTALLRRWPTLRLSAIQLTNRIRRFQWDGMFDLVDAHIARACWSNRQLLEVMVDFWSNHLNVTCPSSEVWATRHLYDAHVIRRTHWGSSATCWSPRPSTRRC